MSNIVRIYTDVSLVLVLEEISKDIAGIIKNKYGLDSITIYDNLSSKALASYWKKNDIKFKIRKTGPKCGVLEIA